MWKQQIKSAAADNHWPPSSLMTFFFLFCLLFVLHNCWALLFMRAKDLDLDVVFGLLGSLYSKTLFYVEQFELKTRFFSLLDSAALKDKKLLTDLQNREFIRVFFPQRLLSAIPGLVLVFSLYWLCTSTVRQKFPVAPQHANILLWSDYEDLPGFQYWRKRFCISKWLEKKSAKKNYDNYFSILCLNMNRFCSQLTCSQLRHISFFLSQDIIIRNPSVYQMLKVCPNSAVLIESD